MRPFISLLIVLFTTISGFAQSRQPAPVNIGSRLELFADSYLIGSMKGADLRLHPPVNAGKTLDFDKPWEGAFCGYVTVLQDGIGYRMYYRGAPGPTPEGKSSHYTCVALSDDGILWKKPELGLFEVMGTKRNNVILAEEPLTHNFSPVIDTRPDVPASERYKAMAGIEESKLFAFVSADGIHWKKLNDTPVITDGAFDSQNVAFWSEHEGKYLCYFRTWTEGLYKGFRTISRAESDDFIHWTNIKEMTYGNTPREHLYTNQTLPYYRAPHIYLSFPMRFFYQKKVLTGEQAAELGVKEGYQSDCAEGVMMTSRGGNSYDRTFMEAYVRPGTDLGNWSSRAGMIANGMLQTSETEISIYKQAHYAQKSAHMLRFTTRIDGFASLHAPYAGGVMTTKPLVFTGNSLNINFSTSAAGFVKVEILNTANRPLNGYSISDADEIIGDLIKRTVTWNGKSDVSTLSGKPVILRFTLKDADLYSIQFSSK